MEIPQIIYDLAVILLTASIVTIVFKKIKQPVVLGYILAGFLIGPYMPYFFSVEDLGSIHAWSEIGIIILMFCLGLEFNFHKFMKVGGTGVITALTEVVGMLIVGYYVGRLLGWSSMDSIFLGGMLSMSSTTIIIKAFDELGKGKEPFAQLVFGTLIIEDIVGIFMMIILSTISISQNISGIDLAVKLLLLLLYLVLWLLAGIYLLPSLLNKAKNFLNDETLLLLSLGICFGMVLLANYLGFSSALGAFMAGSLLAGTVHSERVEHLTNSIKDLFGSVFFISVGMMIEPVMLKKYVLQIILLSLVTIVGKLIISSMGVLLSGNRLSTAIHCGCSLAQIGEFAFIIASLGASLGAIDDFIYPIIVSVSVITTLTTPFFIKSADKIVDFVNKVLPAKITERLDRITDDDPSEKGSDSDWQAFFKRYLKRTMLFSLVMLSIMTVFIYFIIPMLGGLVSITGKWVLFAALAVIYVVIGLFIRPMMDYENPYYTSLWIKSPHYHLPLVALNAIKLVIVAAIAWMPLEPLLGNKSLFVLPIILVLLLIAAKSKRFASAYLHVQTRFMSNLNERQLSNFDPKSREIDWLDKKLYIHDITVSDALDGKALSELSWGHQFGVNAVKIVHAGKHINIPRGYEKVYSGDEIYVIGEYVNLKNLVNTVNPNSEFKPQTLHDYNEITVDPNTDLYTFIYRVGADSPFKGHAISDSGIRENSKVFILGLQRGKLPVLRPDVNFVIKENDIVWLLGPRDMAARILAKDF